MHAFETYEDIEFQSFVKIFNIPESWFSERLSKVKFAKAPKLSGIIDEISFPEIPRIDRLEHFPILSGSEPEILFLAKASIVKFVKFPMLLGMQPGPRGKKKCKKIPKKLVAD